jgi:dihydrofolate reductase
MEVIIISAMTKNGRVIGRDNWLPWDIPEELAMFRRLTSGSTVIMGRKTYESIGRLMPKRQNIIVSLTLSSVEGADVCGSVEEAIDLGKKYGKDVFVIGGAQIYRLAIPLVDKMYISYIKKDYEGDTYFPSFDENDWKIERRENHDEFDFVVYSRKK